MKGFLIIAFTLSAASFEPDWNEEIILEKFIKRAKNCQFDKSQEIIVLQNELFKQTSLTVNGYKFVIQDKETMFFNRTENYWSIRVTEKTANELAVVWQYNTNEPSVNCKTIKVKLTQ